MAAAPAHQTQFVSGYFHDFIFIPLHYASLYLCLILVLLRESGLKIGQRLSPVIAVDTPLADHPDSLAPKPCPPPAAASELGGKRMITLYPDGNFEIMLDMSLFCIILNF